ncbi:hypothetical protein N1851_006973 [Merluccius polli]|uniref:Uncharacterized protein n=1 Tax=Merluccius polli TaxID=89951 RepID=A0AA47N3M8_MERPO|nr:hypothetical protein N1851_006973 [Merluccius polli]
MDEALCVKMTNIMHTAYYVAKEELLSHSLGHCMASTGLEDNFQTVIGLTKPVLGSSWTFIIWRGKLLNKIKSPLENELIHVRFLSTEGPVNAYLSIQDVKHGNAVGILNAIHAAFEEAGMSDWKERLAVTGQL